MYGSPGRFGDSDDPWFRLGGFGVTTTALVVGMGVLSMLVWAVEGPSGAIFDALNLRSDRVIVGEVWRLVTWPIPNQPDIWTVILFAVMFMLGSQLEAIMGRRSFTIFLGALTVIPAVVVTLLHVVGGPAGGAEGLRFLELGVLVAFVAHFSQARFFFGIPGWVIAAVIIGIDTLQFLGLGAYSSLMLLFCVVAVALLGIRAFGFAEDQQWIPVIPFPGAGGGSSTNTTTAKAPSKKRSGRRPKLKSVPPPMTKLEEDLSQMEIDALLDQVSRDGLGSLSKDERKRLEQHSKRMRDRDI